MSGIDPSVLAAIGASQMGGGPAQMQSPEQPPQYGEEKAEPVALAEECDEAMRALDLARSSMADLAAQAQMAGDMDPKIEKMVTDHATTLDQMFEDLEQVSAHLGQKRAAHEGMVGGKAPASPPAAAPPG